jgi:hypothetical protein
MALKTVFNPLTGNFDQVQNLQAITENLLPLTDSAIDLGSSTKYFANSYIDKMHVATDVFWTGLALSSDTLQGASAGGMNTNAQVAIQPKNDKLLTDSAGGIYGLWVERTANRSAYTNGGGTLDFAGISGRLQVSDNNCGYNTEISALSFNPYIMKNYQVAPAGSLYMKNNGCKMEGSQSWFSIARLQNAKAFNGLGMAHGFWSWATIKEYSASF